MRRLSQIGRLAAYGFLGSTFLTAGLGATPQPGVLLFLAAAGPISPARVSATLAPLECIQERKHVTLPAMVPEADIVFVMDLTGSMGGELAALVGNIDAVAAELSTRISNPAFGLITHRDYEGSFPSCGYSIVAPYGNPGDFPYRLEVPVTTDIAAIRTALGGLVALNGGDEPEGYVRALYELYSDPALGLRPGAHRIAVAFGDAIPHDCDLYACIGQPGTTTGVDPGRDASTGTGDDLVLQEVLDGLNAGCFTLLFLYSGDSGDTPEQFAGWDCWARQTGGQAYQINDDGSVPGGIELARAIGDLVATDVASCDPLTLTASPGFESWLTGVTPPSYTGVGFPGAADFDIDICVPAGTAAGTYTFQVEASCDLASCGTGLPLGAQEVTIEVPACSAAAEAGASQTVCQGDSFLLDGGASMVTSCAGGLEYHWREGAAEMCPWSPAPDCGLTALATATFTLDVRCASRPECTATDDVLVTVKDCTTAVIYGGYGAEYVSPEVVRISWTTLTETATLAFAVLESDSPVDDGHARVLGVVPTCGPGHAYSLEVGVRAAAGPTWYKVAEITSRGYGDMTPFFRGPGRTSARARRSVRG